MSNSVLPLYDSELDVQEFNIYQPFKRILPYDLPKRNAITPAETAITKKEPTLDTYCKTCKKKFSNEPTFNNHLKSAKHIANEKKAKPFTITTATATTTKGPNHQQRIAIDPKVQDALVLLDQAENSDNATVAMTTYWTQAQILYALKRPRYTEKALHMLIDLINTSPVTTYSSAQIASFLYNARLALARLLCIYQQLDACRRIYLDAIADKWKLETLELLGIAKNIRTLSIHALICACDQLATKYLTRERNRTKPAPALTDPNNSVTSILCEAANLFAQQDQKYDAILSEHIAIVLYTVCSLVCPYAPLSGLRRDDIYYLMIQVFTSLDGLEYKIIEIYALDTTNTWSMFNALLIAIEMDDLVRAQTIQANLKQLVYPDVQLLCSLYRQKSTLCIDNDMSQQLDFILLLLDETTEPLVLRNRSRQERSGIIERIHKCIYGSS